MGRVALLEKEKTGQLELGLGLPMSDRRPGLLFNRVSFIEKVHEFVQARKEAGTWLTKAEQDLFARRKVARLRWVYGGRYPR